jgi:flagellar hook-associated protein 3 FlgL
MTIERVATSNQSDYMVSQITKANANLQKSSQQVASGKASTDYAGIGDKTAALEGARAVSARASAYVAGTQLAVTQTDLQNTQLTTLSGLASQLQSAVQSAAANSDGSGLMTTAQSVFDQAAAILNSTDSNGNYIYGGEITNSKPFTATSLSDLTSGSISDYFSNGTVKKTVQVGDGQTEQIGVLASDIGTDLMTALKSLSQADTSSSLSSTLTQTQVNGLTDTVLPLVATASTSLNAANAANGETYSSLNTSITSQQSMQTLYDGFVSDIEDADMATALTNFSNNQTALQAVLTVTSKLNSKSLLDYLPTS